jgi:peptide alpha-N-acetyltransferase
MANNDAGEQFKPAADKYLKRMLGKGVPSTFANIKTLYTSPEKLATIQELVEGYASDPKAANANGSAKQSNGDSSTRFEQAVYYFLAHHYDYHKSRDLKKAADYAEKAITLDPKSVFYTMTKARIIKHTGDLVKAAEVMNQARELDEKDRYINTKCAKYQLRRDDNEAAIGTMSKFTRNETVGGALGDLHDMQCMWYITEDGDSYLRQGKISLALKRFKSIYDIFDVWQEDQFDFHQFSLRKGQIRAYVEMMRWEDKLREHPFYSRAALKAIKIYTMLYDNPELANSSLTNGVDLDKLDPAEKKKALKKARKEAEKKAQEEHERKEAANKAKKPGTGADGEPKKEDPDPQGLKLLETKTPLDEAVKFLLPLLELSPKNIEAQNAAFEVYLRRGRFLLALKALIAAHQLDEEQSVLHEQLVRFRQAREQPLFSFLRSILTRESTVDKAPKSDSPKLDEVLKANLSIVPASKDLKSFNDAYLSKHQNCASRTQAGLKARHLIDPSTKAQNEKDLVASLEKADLKEAIEGLEILKLWKSDKKVGEEYVKVARGRWSDATVFK